MEGTPLISVIVPVYNVESYLPRCLDSIINQSYGNLEIILVNDGSTDKSGTICDEYSKKDKRIRVVHSKNCGVSSARNRGLLAAKGEYIGFVDSDDYIDIDMYQLLVKKMVEEKVDIVTCRYCFDYDGEIKEAANLSQVPQYPINTKDFLYYVYKRDEYKGVANYVFTKLYNSKLIKNDKGELLLQFKEEYKLGEDNVFNAEAYCKSENISFLDKALYYYYQRNDSVMHNKELQLNTLSILKGYEKVIDIFEKHDISKEIVDLVKRFYVYFCGIHLEFAKENSDEKTKGELKTKINKCLQIYIETNQDYPERVQWILGLME